jgi:AcrR family transcriptional regulator
MKATSEALVPGTGASARRRVPRQARSRERVSKILAAAQRLLVEEGPESLNTNRIATEAGVAVGSVYEYFPDKHAIAMALLDTLSERETTLIMARFDALADAPLPELVQAVVELTFAVYREHHVLYRSLWSMTSILREVGERPTEQLIVQAVRQRLAPFAGELGIPDLDFASVMVFHLVESLSMQLVGQTAFAPEACTQAITRAVLGYLGLPSSQ